jgi:hypothetical protein
MGLDGENVQADWRDRTLAEYVLMPIYNTILLFMCRTYLTNQILIV